VFFKFISFLSIFFLLINTTILKADPKKKIIDNINKTNSTKFNFVQISNNKTEKGICFLKRPYYLKCEYNDKNQKQLIVNKNNLVIYHKRYEKIYNYPLSKSYFTEILNSKKFSNIVKNGSLEKANNNYIIKYFFEKKGEIVFYFGDQNYTLNGWDLLNLNNSKISFKILNSEENYDVKKTFFDIPKKN
tara:strand:+ start:3398 stop:3964 length:567 start_codon:yes stop_codon:yes gene_type:complete